MNALLLTPHAIRLNHERVTWHELGHARTRRGAHSVAHLRRNLLDGLRAGLAALVAHYAQGDGAESLRVQVLEALAEGAFGAKAGCPLTSYSMSHRWQTSSGWSAWYSLGGCVYYFDVGMNYDGREELFGHGNDDRVWHDWQENPDSGPWSGWNALGTAMWGPSPWTGSDMSPNWQPNMHVYADGYYNSNQRWYNYQTSPGCCWSGWIQG